jgi:PII-like signaling protein
MEINGEARLLRIYISSTDKFKHAPLYEVVVFAAKRYGLAGATVLKGFMGFGASSVVRSQKLWEITEKLPLVIEIVDEAAKIDGFVETILPYFEKIPKGGLITLEKVNIVLHKSGTKPNSFFR